MNWFKGSIGEAIGASRQRKCIFVVVVTAEDASSQQLLAKLEEKQVSDLFNNFVSICLKNGSTEATQFSQLYPLVVLPSIYMIGLEGTPLEIIGGLVDTPTLISRAQAASDMHNTTSGNSFSTPGQQVVPEINAGVTASSNISIAPDLRTNQEEQNVEREEGSNESTDAATSLPLQVRLEKANQLIATVREKKAEEEQEKEKLKERERRDLGKQLQQLKEAQKEREQRELAESRQKEKREEKEALEKIRQQIAQDRADRAARYQAAQASEEERKRTAQSAQEQLQQERASASAQARSAFARLQFRLPDGSTRTEQFASDVKLRNVAEFIDQQIQPPFSPYTICTTFPRREFGKENMDSSLRDLDLAPSAALLIVPTSTTHSQVRSSPGAGSGTSWINSIFAPLYWMWNWIYFFLFPPTARQVTQSPTIQPTRQTESQNNQGGVRRRRPEGNVRRLADASPEDSSDDNATWNGNSTQQL